MNIKIDFSTRWRIVTLLFGLLCCGVLAWSTVNTYAAASFSSLKPMGVMATAVKTSIAVSWEPVEGAEGYTIYEAEKTGPYSPVLSTEQTSYIKKACTKGKTYRFYVKAYKTSGEKTLYSAKSQVVSTTVSKKGVSTIKNFLKTGLAPMGSTMYVWGGGWNKADTAAGPTTRRIGLTPGWRAFAEKQKAGYNYKKYRYQIMDGLDCSGYVGFCLYNIQHTKNNLAGYVYPSSKMAATLAKKGFGSYKTRKYVKNYQAGDIMSSNCSCCRHTWIVAGQCSDGSVVLMHASPEGVKLSGTPSKSGQKNSKALKLAKTYMKKYYPSWYMRYPNVSCSAAYLSHYSQMRWKGSVLTDPDGYKKKRAEQILADLFKN